MLELPVIARGSQLDTCTRRCGARCCKYYSLVIDTPRSDRDFDNLRWYLMHGDTHVYKFDGEWYLMVWRTCRHLLPDNRCGIYERRPAACADYDPSDCEFTGEVDYELYFRDDAELETWLAARAERRQAAARRGWAKRRGARTSRRAGRN